MINYTKTTLNKEGVLREDNVTYAVNFTAVNNELMRLHCSITKVETKQHPNANGGYSDYPEERHIGDITLENGRQITEIVQGENLIPYLTKFQEIVNDVMGNTSQGYESEKSNAKK